MKQCTFMVSGNVQKAGYRDRVIELGKFVNLTGYAENLPDGRVRIIAEREDETDDRLDTAANILKDVIVNMNRGFDKLNSSLNAGFGTLVKGQELHIEITRNGFAQVKNEIHMQRDDFKEMFLREVSELHIEINEIKATLARMQTA